MYEIYGYPVLKAAFERYSPNPGDTGVPALRFRNGSSSTTSWDLKHDWLQNFGPTLTVEEIHRHIPTACIDGQIAPFTFMNNDSEKITAEVKRDCEMAKEHQGLNLITAGSINNGSLFTSMHTVMRMEAIQEYGLLNTYV